RLAAALARPAPGGRPPVRRPRARPAHAARDRPPHRAGLLAGAAPPALLRPRPGLREAGAHPGLEPLLHLPGGLRELPGGRGGLTALPFSSRLSGVSSPSGPPRSRADPRPGPARLPAVRRRLCRSRPAPGLGVARSPAPRRRLVVPVLRAPPAASPPRSDPAAPLPSAPACANPR